MSLGHISEFAVFLSNGDRSLKEILDHLTRVVFSKYGIESMTYLEVNDTNGLKILESSGTSLEVRSKVGSVIDLEDKYPVSDVFRYGQTIWINTLPDWGDEYPLKKTLVDFRPGKTYIAFSIYYLGTPVGVMTLYSRLKIERNEEAVNFFDAIGHIFSMYFYRKSSSANILKKDKGVTITPTSAKMSPELTDRQLVILRLISEDHTNHEIAKLLDYSESTIRQEIMKIFSVLGCANRNEAAKIYRSMSKD